MLSDEVMAAALTDRLLHHCHIVNVRGNSCRMREHQELRESMRRRAAPRGGGAVTAGRGGPALAAGLRSLRSLREAAHLEAHCRCLAALSLSFRAVALGADGFSLRSRHVRFGNQPCEFSVTSVIKKRPSPQAKSRILSVISSALLSVMWRSNGG